MQESIRGKPFNRHSTETATDIRESNMNWHQFIWRSLTEFPCRNWHLTEMSVSCQVNSRQVVSVCVHCYRESSRIRQPPQVRTVCTMCTVRTVGTVCTVCTVGSAMRMNWWIASIHASIITLYHFVYTNYTYICTYVHVYMSMYMYIYYYDCIYTCIYLYRLSPIPLESLRISEASGGALTS